MSPRPLAALLAAERRRARARLFRLRPLSAEIEREVAARSGPVDVLTPTRHGRWWLAARTLSDGDRAVHARRPVRPDEKAPTADEFWAADVEVLLDERRLGRRARVGVVVVARDAETVASTVDRRGGERFDLLVDGRVRQRAVAPQVAVSPDGRSVLAVELDRDGRPAVAVALGRLKGRRELAVEPDPGRWLEVTEDGGVATLASRSLDGDRLWLVGDDGALEPVPVEGVDARAVAVDERRILMLADGRLTEWVRGGPCRPIDLDLAAGTTVEEVVVVDGVPVLVVRTEGERMLVRLDSTAPVPTVPRAHRPAHPGESLDLLTVDGTRLLGTVCSLVLPPTPWSLDVRSGTLLRGPTRPAVGRQSVTRAPARDGESIPVTLAAASDLPPGPRPLVLLVYGAYGVPFEPRYSPGTAALLDRGAVLAIAHVRGGGERGPAWHDAARGLSKHVSVDDYLDVAEFLVAEGWTTRGAIIGQGSSAGATIVGAALNRDPGLFAGAVVSAPFVDPLAALLDESSPLAAVDVPEWGDPRTEAGRRALAAISPALGVSPERRYPPVLASTGIHDPRAPVRDVARWIDALRSAGSDATLLLDVGGHEGPASRRAERERFATELAWMLDVLGLA
ncbi:prolyl oligopeptidase family serine peptidase [Schumannella luteola]